MYMNNSIEHEFDILMARFLELAEQRSNYHPEEIERHMIEGEMIALQEEMNALTREWATRRANAAQ